MAHVTHEVALTPNGEPLLDLPRESLAAGERLARLAVARPGARAIEEPGSPPLPDVDPVVLGGAAGAGAGA